MCAQFLGQEDSLKKELATHSSVLAWEVPWTDVTGGCGPQGHKRVRRDWAHTHTYNVGTRKI